MRKVLLCIVLITLSSCAGKISYKEFSGIDTEYQKIIDFPNISKEKIYDFLLEYLKSNFNDFDSTLIMDSNKTDGKIKGTINFPMKFAEPNDGFIVNMDDTICYSKFLIECKDEKARFTFSNYYYYTKDKIALLFKYETELLMIRERIDSLANQIIKAFNNESKSNW